MSLGKGQGRDFTTERIVTSVLLVFLRVSVSRIFRGFFRANVSQYRVSRSDGGESRHFTSCMVRCLVKVLAWQ